MMSNLELFYIICDHSLFSPEDGYRVVLDRNISLHNFELDAVISECNFACNCFSALFIPVYLEFCITRSLLR